MKRTHIVRITSATVSFFRWYGLVFILRIAAQLIVGVVFLRKIITTHLRMSRNAVTQRGFEPLRKKNKASIIPISKKILTHYQHTLNAHIKHCKQLSPRPVITPNPNKIVDVTIIVPVFNQWHLTKACLNSILDTCDEDINYELILADDCSTDDTRFASHDYPGLTIIKPFQNIGFLKNCNHAAKKAQGRYIVLLNNDTIVLPNWLQALFTTLENDSTAAMTGSKILFKNGKIQEAGVTLFREGQVCGIGVRRLRFTPIFNIERETDYISGCSIMIRKSFWDAVGGFDERYQTAYYEDSDLAMTARMLNMRVIYQPASEVIHFKHKTYARYTQKTRRSLLKKNKAIFLDKWTATLNEHPPRVPWHLAMSHAERTPSLTARNHRAKGQCNILFYSPDPLYPNKHGNRVRMCNLVKNLQEMGHVVHLALLKSYECTDDNVTFMRNKLNCTIDLIPSRNFRVSPGSVPFDGWYEKGIGEAIRCLCDKYAIDAVICTYVFQSKLLEYVPAHVLKIIDTHDKMANRTKMLRANKLSIGQFSCTVADEAAYLKRADIVIGITEEETIYFEQISQKNTVTISHIEAPRFLEKKFTTVYHVGIVASNNRFNRAMLRLFLESVNRYLQGSNECPFTIHIVGEIKNGVKRRQYLSRKMHVFRKPWVINHGFVTDISQIYDQMDIIASPMMCGTGINIKMVEALAYGLPLLTTRHGARGIETNDPMHQHPDIDSLVSHLFELITKPDELERLSALSRTIYSQFYTKNQINLKALFNHSKLMRAPQLSGI